MADNNSKMEWGRSGKVLVFLHYFGGTAGSWQWVAENLKDSFRCIAINLPGFGDTPAFDQQSIQRYATYVQDQLNILQIKVYFLIGHSMGGKIAMQVAADAIEGSVQQLILIAPSPPSQEPMATEEKAQMLKRPSQKEAEEMIAKITRKTLSEDQYRLAVKTQLNIDYSTRQWWLLNGMAHSILANVKPIRLPITVLASEDDPVISLNIIKERVIDVFVQSKLITIRQVGHLIPMEVPAWVAEKIESIIKAET